ncbi:hypothetical protein K435DRAFT_959704 [Dendrothele bispora CBS 962.96]|uniref:Uncharacterized protein n=1 Tax=Dendrothele bispora (strain CBS 962.96) TaxID=1314807 RepID=A0A4S8MWT2_DENBC|nr:hypothetical protein K435DRAFT_959704 [Dendrothele bispora CBS 962.96]
MYELCKTKSNSGRVSDFHSSLQTMSRADIELRVGPKPDWELEENQDSDLHDISTSSVLSYVLKQSREKWLSSNLIKLSGKGARGKVTENTSLPAHTIHARGKCDLEIGPHIFCDTAFYEAHYTPVPVQPSSSQWSAGTAAAHTSTASGSSSSGTASSPLISSITPVTMITPTLINHVNNAAASNPTLANLLQVAAAGKASSDQLKTLGLLIQSLATSPQVSASYGPSTYPYATTSASAVPPREFDLVIEFKETSHERWIFPRGTSSCEHVTDDSSTGVQAACDITLTCHTTLNKSPSNGEPSAQSSGTEPQLLILKFNKAPMVVWDTLLRWVGGEQKNRDNLETLSKLKTRPSSYLAYRLPDSLLLDQLQAATALPYTMKSIKPSLSSGSSRPRRRPSQKKPSDVTAPSRKKSTDGKAATEGGNNDTTPSMSPKRPRQSKSKATAVQIRCLTCNQADVPLMLGGRFCRPCVEAGKANPDIPQMQGSTASYVPKVYASPVLSTPNATLSTATTTVTAPMTQAPAPAAG